MKGCCKANNRSKGGGKMKTIKFRVDDMIWPSCAEAIKTKLAGLDCVTGASADPNSKEVTVLLAYPQSSEGVFCAVEDLGYHIGDSDGIWFG
jgi:copper chaperone CopZ